MNAKEWIGKKFGPYRLEVKQDRARLLAEAVHGKVRDGYAPPTYLTIAREGEFAFLDAAKLPLKRILHGEQSYHFEEALKIGQTLDYETVVKEAYEKKGSTASMTFFILESNFRDDEGREVASACTNFIYREPKQ